MHSIAIPHSNTYLSLEKYFYKVLRKVYRATLRFRKNPRPPTNPFITGDSFRALADHIYDETGSFDPSTVKRGDIVFVGSPYMHRYFSSIHPQIQEKYVLIQHNGDIETDETISRFIDDKIVRFYAQVTTVSHPKIIPIPIGINNMHHGVDGFPWLIRRRIPQKKLARIFYHFSNQTNPKEREPALAYFKTVPFMETMHAFVGYGTYKSILASYMFTVSPAGNTLGSHRTWEALYLRTIPIVKRTVDAESCVARGLPLWILDDWKELDAYTEATLAEKYTSMLQDASFNALYMDYWINLIQKDQASLSESSSTHI